jgi:putative transport protein
MEWLPIWFNQLLLPQESPSIAASIVTVFLVLFLGILLGKIKLMKVSLGVSGVIFVGIFFGHLGYKLHPEIQEFLRDFGLILFVYAIGMQLGPSFFSRLKQDGIKYNGLALITVAGAMFITWGIHALYKIPMESAAGLMTGAVTNTPSLGAAKAALQDLSHQFPNKVFADPTHTYAIAYPIGILGIIFLLLLVKVFYRKDIAEEIELFKAEIKRKHPEPQTLKCRVINADAIGKSIDDLLKSHQLNVIVSRLKHSGSEKVVSPTGQEILIERDVLMLVGLPQELDKAVAIFGYASSDQFIESQQDMRTQTLVVTNNLVIQKTLAQLHLEKAYEAKVTRVYRSGMELLAYPELILHYGDRVRVVGSNSALEAIAKLFGNSEKRLQEPQLLSIFVGIVLGVILGSIPFFLPGLSVPMKLGVAAGPLLVAILISRFGGIKSLHSYLQQSALSFMKDFGICLFFASIGIHAGETFYEIFVQNNGFFWLIQGLLITLIPGLLMILLGKYIFKISLIPLLGLIAGAHTDPAALEFATNYYKTELPLQSYATVYPLTTLARIVSVQILIIYFT